MRVAIYARVSTKEQCNELQLEELRKFASHRGYIIVEEFVDVITGDMEKRDDVFVGYNRMLLAATEKKFEAILVWKFDRFARSLIDLCVALKQFRKMGIGFISATQPIDTTGPLGRLNFQILAMFAEFEREMIAERMRAGRKYVQEHGFNARGLPSKLGRREMLSEEKKANILRRYAANETLKAIALAEGMPLPTVYSFLKRTVLRCEHGKYRCKLCRKSRRISQGTTTAEAPATVAGCS